MTPSRPSALSVLLQAVCWCVVASIAPLGASAQTDGDVTPGQVTLPLVQYLDLRERVERAEAERLRTPGQGQPMVAEVTSRHSRLVVDGERVRVSSTIEVEVRGQELRTVPLATVGVVERATVDPADGASLSYQDGQLLLVAREAGHYTVKTQGLSDLDLGAGRASLLLTPSSARVSLTEIDLPAELRWSCNGAVVVEDQVESGRRQLELALSPGVAYSLDLSREVGGAAQSAVHARNVVVTVLDLSASGLRREDVVLYEVSRGSLAELAIRLPTSIEVERVATDEGPAIPIEDDDRLRVVRQRKLEGQGFLKLTSFPSNDKEVDLVPLTTDFPVRANYLVFASTVAAQLEPSAGDWSRTDVEDLPAMLRRALPRLEIAAVWRAPAQATGRFVLDVLDAVDELATVVRRRTSTSLVTVDGSLVQRDEIVVSSDASSLAFELPAGAVVWSASVDGQALRPVEKDGALHIPLVLGRGGDRLVELVSVLDGAIAAGRSTMSLALPVLRVPVLDHRWRLLLPEQNRYRYEAGELVPVASISDGRTAVGLLSGLGGTSGVRGTVSDENGAPLPGVTVTLSSARLGQRVAITNENGAYWFNEVPRGAYSLTAALDGMRDQGRAVEARDEKVTEVSMSLGLASTEAITVTSEAPLVDRFNVAGELNEMKKSQLAREFRDATADLRQGTVGGVRPLPVEIPESGKVLNLAGALPPPLVHAELSVRAGR